MPLSPWVFFFLLCGLQQTQRTCPMKRMLWGYLYCLYFIFLQKSVNLHHFFYSKILGYHKKQVHFSKEPFFWRGLCNLNCSMFLNRQGVLCKGYQPTPKMVTNSFGKRNFMQPMGSSKHALKMPCFFFIFPWFPICSL